VLSATLLAKTNNVFQAVRGVGTLYAFHRTNGDYDLNTTAWLSSSLRRRRSTDRVRLSGLSAADRPRPKQKPNSRGVRPTPRPNIISASE